jgi:hypothetical protein
MFFDKIAARVNHLQLTVNGDKHVTIHAVLTCELRVGKDKLAGANGARVGALGRSLAKLAEGE